MIMYLWSSYNGEFLLLYAYDCGRFCASLPKDFRRVALGDCRGVLDGDDVVLGGFLDITLTTLESSFTPPE